MMTFEEILAQYALPVVIMAAIVMAVLGVLKIFTKVMPKNKTPKTIGEAEGEPKVKTVMGHLYVIIAPALSFGVVCAYFAIFHLDFDWSEIGKQSSLVWGCTQALYPLYRDLGVRSFCKKFISAVGSVFKGKDRRLDKIVAMIDTVIPLSDKQKDAIKDKLK